jgi:hypothetical protein
MLTLSLGLMFTLTGVSHSARSKALKVSKLKHDGWQGMLSLYFVE